MTESEYKELAEILFEGEDLKTPEEYEEMYPYRKLGKKAEVTRLAPSPTGFIHLGNLYSALADERAAHAHDGSFFLRIEDTDAKRKVDGALELIIESLGYFGISFDEGAHLPDTDSVNVYAPYTQSERRGIYHTFAKKLVEEGRAYPCFCTEEELEAVRNKQEAAKVLTGYYGEFAVWRDKGLDEIKAKLAAGEPYVLRLRSEGDPEKEFIFKDEIKGEVKLPENITDIVILKKDGIPTYHFAQAVDDHLMRTTLVIRGGEWLASVPVHMELFESLGFKPPKYAHTAHLMKIDPETGGKRKLSKRSDPEMSLSFYKEEGYHPHCIKVYLMTLLNSDFEEWHRNNPDSDLNDFPFSVKKMNNSGALFDMDKLENICKNELSLLDENVIADFLKAWALEYGTDAQKAYFADEEKMLAALRLYMGVGQKRRRKDLVNARQALELMSYLFEDADAQESDPFRVDEELRKAILQDYLDTFSYTDDNGEWFEKLKEIAERQGFATDRKLYKENPEKFKGETSDVAEVVRIAVTGRANTPDLWGIIHVMGEEKMRERIAAAM